MSEARGRVLVGGSAKGQILALAKPISFWGGIDPTTGQVIDPRHPNFGTPIHKTVLTVPAVIGSSSSSNVMLELLRNRMAPAAVVLGSGDTILPLGILIARELGYPTIPVLQLSDQSFATLPKSGEMEIQDDGTITF